MPARVCEVAGRIREMFVEFASPLPAYIQGGNGGMGRRGKVSATLNLKEDGWLPRSLSGGMVASTVLERLAPVCTSKA